MAVGERFALERAGVGHGAQREDRRERHPDADGDHEVERDRRGSGRQQQHGIATARAEDPRGGAELDHAHGGDRQDTGEGGEWNFGHERGERDDDCDQDDAVDDRRDPRARAGADIDGGAGDGTRGRHPSEQRHGDVGEALADQFAVGVVTLAVGQSVSDLRRQQALQCGERGDGHDRGEELGKVSDVDGRKARTRQPCGDGPDPCDRQIRQPCGNGRDRHGDERGGKRSVEPGEHDHHHDHERDDCERIEASADPAFNRSVCHDGGVGPLGLGNAERRRDLLEEDQQRDPHREALDHRPRENAGIAAQSQRAGDDEKRAREERHDENAGRAELRDDRDQHDRHGARRTADLEVRPAEDARDDARDDRGHDAGFRPEPGGDAECQRERERDDGDGDARREVAAPAATQSRIVATTWEQPPETGDPSVPHETLSSSRVVVSMSRRICFDTARTSAMRSSASAYTTFEPSRRVTTRPARRRTASCCERWGCSTPTATRRSATDCSPGVSSSSTRIRTGCPRVLKNSALK